jgi:hypothetical protein
MADVVDITLKRVGAGASIRDFMHVPHITQGHDPYWIAPIPELTESARLSPKKNPWFQHGEAALWVAAREGKLVGRISAQVDRNHLQLYRDETGFFGFFECVDDQSVADALFDAAFVWLREKGMRRCVGPFSFNINDESGLLIDGFNCPPRIAMGHAQPYYQRLVEAAGFTKVVDMLAYLTPMDTALPSYRRLIRLNRGIERNPRLKVRALDPSRYHQDFAEMMKIWRAGWIDNWGSIPPTEAEAKHLAKELKPLLLPELVSIATLDNEPAAFCLALPDLNEMIRDLKGSLFPFAWAKLLWRVLLYGLALLSIKLIALRFQPHRHSRDRRPHRDWFGPALWARGRNRSMARAEVAAKNKKRTYLSLARFARRT